MKLHPNAKPAAERASRNLNIRCRSIDLNAWKRAARAARLPLTRWVIERLNYNVADPNALRN